MASSETRRYHHLPHHPFLWSFAMLSLFSKSLLFLLYLSASAFCEGLGDCCLQSCVTILNPVSCALDWAEICFFLSFLYPRHTCLSTSSLMTFATGKERERKQSTIPYLETANLLSSSETKGDFLIHYIWWNITVKNDETVSSAGGCTASSHVVFENEVLWNELMLSQHRYWSNFLLLVIELICLCASMSHVISISRIFEESECVCVRIRTDHQMILFPPKIPDSSLLSMGNTFPLTFVMQPLAKEIAMYVPGNYREMAAGRQISSLLSSLYPVLLKVLCSSML